MQSTNHELTRHCGRYRRALQGSDLEGQSPCLLSIDEHGEDLLHSIEEEIEYAVRTVSGYDGKRAISVGLHQAFGQEWNLTEHKSELIQTILQECQRFNKVVEKVDG